MKTFFALALLCVAVAAWADDVFQHPTTAEELLQGVLAEPARQSNQAQVIRGQFVYRKYLAELPAPLQSTGEYLFVKNLGIVWRTLQPFDSEFVITAKGIVEREAGKSSPANADEQPAVRVAARIFLSLLSLDVQTLRSTFDLYGLQAGSHWQIGLRPTSSAIAAVFRDAIIGGASQVETVTLHDANGDRTEILFENMKYEQAAPSAQDRQRFRQ